MSDINDVFGIKEKTQPTKPAPPSAMAGVADPAAAQSSSHSAKAGKRYKEGYLVAGKIVDFGNAVRAILCVLGGVIFLGGIGTCSSVSNGAAGQGLEGAMTAGAVVMLFGVGLLVCILGWIVGTLIMAYGQLIKSSLDCSVNTSPFLSTDEKASAMSL